MFACKGIFARYGLRLEERAGAMPTLAVGMFIVHENTNIVMMHGEKNFTVVQFAIKNKCSLADKLVVGTRSPTMLRMVPARG